MKILITGGAGYIGTTLVPKLLERGYEVSVYDRLLFGGNALLPFFRHKNFSFIKADIRNRELLEQACVDKDVIIHLAAIVGFPACREHPDLAESTNVLGTQILASVVRPDQLVLFGSTGSNYGTLVSGVCTEETPLNPVSIYGRTKTEAEKILLQQTKCIAYRFATAFGLSPRLRLDLLVNDLTFQAIKQKYIVVYESHFMRTFIHVEDIARSFLFAIDHHDKMIGQAYNMGSETMNYSKREVCEKIVAHTGTTVHYADIGEDADQRNYVVSYEKISSLGFATSITLEEGIAELVRALPAIHITNPYSNA